MTIRHPPGPTVGRFAPSPTGDLHLGSLVSATASYLSARAAQGRWLVRIEDVDAPRLVPSALDNIPRTLESFGFAWDAPLIFQSDREQIYSAALEILIASGCAYRCRCSRSQLQAAGHDSRYPGTCRAAQWPDDQDAAWRFRLPADATVTVEDRWQGRYVVDVEQQCGDFVIRRRDGLFAYQLAVVVDDAEQGVTEVVRGYDLLDNTPRQCLLQDALNLPRPAYAHVPLVVEPDGSKLAKSRRSLPLDPAQAPAQLWTALALLQQLPPADLQRAPVAEIWRWALEHWAPHRLSGIAQVIAPSLAK